MTSPNSGASETFVAVPDPLQASPSATVCYSTGLADLDVVAGGGICPGDLWVIVSAPGQGRSMLLTQLASHLAVEHAVPTYLVSNRDSAAVVSARLHAHRARVPLGHITERRLTDQDRARLARTTPALQAAPLRIAAGPYARHRTVEDLMVLAKAGPVAAAFDDPDWETTWDLHEARRLADLGATVIVALTRDRLLRRTKNQYDLEPDAGLADLVVEVRHDRISATGGLEPVGEPGRAVLTILRNRHGPRYDFSVGCHAHMAHHFDAGS